MIKIDIDKLLEDTVDLVDVSLLDQTKIDIDRFLDQILIKY